VIGDQLELGLLIPVRDETSLAGNDDDHGQASTPPAKDARHMRAACLRETAVERIAKQLSSGSVLQNAFSTLLANESEIILDKFAVVD
jgi:hypothetical protein